MYSTGWCRGILEWRDIPGFTILTRYYAGEKYLLTIQGLQCGEERGGGGWNPHNSLPVYSNGVTTRTCTVTMF